MAWKLLNIIQKTIVMEGIQNFGFTKYNLTDINFQHCTAVSYNLELWPQFITVKKKFNSIHLVIGTEYSEE